ncbi:cyclic-phosphate processing receiver domain-containing protein [Shewanella mangrovi]|uniref:cyclic-phosphate processing receiver domain-containing protein n=1 Tax=Shewanella mangrovi TaxID=1515746 RepID=UPI0005600BB2
MKIFFDDGRLAPDGWGQVTHISLAHDLGDDDRGTGYDVLVWIEHAILKENFRPTQINVHTGNPPALLRMLSAVSQFSLLFRMNAK